ncbi:4-oxalocrotonate tautomerase [Neorhizobium sp. 2083]|uniref:tautomerase family protein n=1 Tax=Neorhizobium sp. 2083 TaxID=2817762 RepID=UPI000DDFDD81|nr:tautomerase family protein [Neorhizobium sp. 2083]MDR6817327.1 4-oxalocrotonate tautomerase [Neorhizobium sp. 2083]
MPHVIVKMIEGRSEEQKQALTAEVTKALMTALGSADSSISVAIQDVPKDDWTDKVYVPDIQGQPDLIYKMPGYDPFK